MYPDKPTRAVCIMLNKDKVLLMHRQKDSEEYWTFIGGGVEENETIEEAVLREVSEETSLLTEIDRLLYIHHYDSSDQYYYLCKYLGGDLVLGDSVEKERMERSNTDQYGPVWVPVRDLNKMLVYPLEIRDWLIEDLDKEFSSETRIAHLKVSDLKKTLDS